MWDLAGRWKGSGSRQASLGMPPPVPAVFRAVRSPTRWHGSSSRARGEVAWFRSVAVLAKAGGEAAVRAAVAEDRVAAARFRLADR